MSQTLHLNDGKAGMEGLDKEYIERVINEASKGSKYYRHATKKKEQLRQRIDKMLQEKKKLTEKDIARAQHKTDSLLRQLEGSRDLTRYIVHVDMDAFYAAVEIRDNPELERQPVAIGSDFMLSTSNYIARRYGVRAAMPGFIARKLCPSLVMISLNFEKYQAASKIVETVIQQYTKEYSMMSLDEAYCDFTKIVAETLVDPATCARHSSDMFSGDPGTDANSTAAASMACSCQGDQVVQDLVQKMRHDIHTATQLTASAGISCNTFLAKVASDMRKPNGQFFLKPDRDTIMDFVSNLLVKKVPGIGPVSQEVLSALGITKISDIITNRALIFLLFTDGSAQFYLSKALGLGSTEVVSCDSSRLSISTETTIPSIRVNNNSSLTTKMEQLLDDLSGELEERLKKERLAGETLSVKLKLATFEVLQRSKTVDYSINKKSQIKSLATDLLKLIIAQNSEKTITIRLFGIRVNNFKDPINSKLQTSIKQFMECCESEEKMDSWVCPICGKEQPPFIQSFNKHIDMCIINHSSEPQGNEDKTPCSSSTNNTKVRNNNVPCTKKESGGSKPSDVRRIAASHQTTLFEHVKDGEDGEGVPENPGSSRKRHKSETKYLPDGALSSSNASDYNCPVCQNVLHMSLSAFNRHLDSCLSQGTNTKTHGIIHPTSKPNREPHNTEKLKSASKSNKESKNCKTLTAFFNPK